MTYKTLVNNVCTNDATVEAVAVALTLHSWATTAVISTINAGKATRVWWASGASAETGHHGSWIFRQVVGIIYIVVALALQAIWNYITTDKAQAHAEIAVRWVRDYGIPGAVQGLDALCCFLLCYEEPETVLVSDEIESLDLSAGAELVRWAHSLRVA